MEFPIGSVIMWAGDTSSSAIPSGWLLCNGDQVSQNKYGALYSVICDYFGQGAVDGQFYLPDFRGQFIRGVSGNSGRDPDSSERVDMQSGIVVGDRVGSVQGQQIFAHSHSYQYTGTYVGITGGAGFVSPTGSAKDQIKSSPTPSVNYGGSETRPINAYLNFIIYAGGQPASKEV